MTFEIGTSDRVLFKRCRRRWNWQSQSRMGLQSKEPNNIHLFIGSGFHFALEDWHGIRHFSRASDAFAAYCGAHTSDELPTAWTEDQMELFQNILDYYTQEWEPVHFGNRFKTVWLNGKPMVEVRFSYPFHKYNGLTKRHKIGRYRYTGTFDRIVKDEYDRLWVMDYKTAGQIETTKLETDPQVAAYTLAAQLIFNSKFEGVVWTQFLKDTPKEPRRLQSGLLSKAKDQRTTHAMFKAELIAEYGSVPQEYVEILNHFAAQEGEHGNKFIRFDMVYKNDHAIKAEQLKIIAESRDMTDKSLSLYPNPTRDCAWDCPFRTPCIAMDDGADYEFILSENYETAPEREERDYWRARIEYPNDPVFVNL